MSDPRTTAPRWPRAGLWILLVLAAFGSGLFAWVYFERAFPLVAVDVRMDRDRAIAAAVRLADARGWGPAEEPRAAASFGVDGGVQAYVELEGGGREAFARLLDDPFYSPYTWRVRRFRPGEANEVSVFFRPSGEPWGFVERVPENQPGAALEPAAARELAARAARDEWQVPLEAYALIESGQERRPSGRIDHTFTYERAGASLGEATFRLRLVVSGDRVTECQRSIKVPDAFWRRYTRMRSANTAIAFASAAAMGVLYVMVAGGAALLVLLRRRALLWKPALLAGALLAGIGLAAKINAWPLAWLGYDTALDERTFIWQWWLFAGMATIGSTFFLAFTFMVAEGLDRLAFPRHPQLWRTWTRRAAASTGIAARTALGYLIVPLDLAYVVAFYFFATRYLGWWIPSDVLVHPDVLATYLPWLGPFASALQAGVWEECLFRAVPIAGAALLGERFGRRGTFIAVAFVVQALVFGGGHAGYPGQPAWSRPIELLVPSFVFGYLYLRLGLLPAILLHVLYNLVLMSLPLFAASGGTIWLDRGIIVLLGLVPVLIVVQARWREGARRPLPEMPRNQAWLAPEPSAPRAAPVPPPPPGPLPVHRTRVIGAVSLAIVLAFLVVHATREPVHEGLHVTRAEAERLARDALAERGATLDERWAVQSKVGGGLDEEHLFVLETAGQEVYRALHGRWLTAPEWEVRAALFEGDLQARAEEWRVSVGADGSIRRVAHQVPEERAGAALDEEAARALARAALGEVSDLDAAQVREVSARPRQRPARTDWSFVFAVDQRPALPIGERRIAIALVGDETQSPHLFVHVPEDWQRERRAATVARGLAGAVVGFGAFGLAIALAVYSVVRWTRGRAAPAPALVVLAAMLASLAVLTLNMLPSLTFGFATAVPYTVQVAIVLVALGVAGLVGSLLLAVPQGLVPGWLAGRLSPRPGSAVEAGVTSGLALQASAAVAYWLWAPWMPAQVPPLGTLAWLTVPSLALAAFIAGTAAVTILGVLVDRVTVGWTRRRVLVTGIAAIAVAAASVGMPTVPVWQAAGVGAVHALAAVAVFVLVARYDLSSLPIATATMALFAFAEMAFAPPFPGRGAGLLTAAASVVALGAGWFVLLRRWAERAAAGADEVEASSVVAP
jgi:hypothetical protein